MYLPSLWLLLRCRSVFQPNPNTSVPDNKMYVISHVARTKLNCRGFRTELIAMCCPKLTENSINHFCAWRWWPPGILRRVVSKNLTDDSEVRCVVALMTKATSTSGTSVSSYQATRRSTPEGCFLFWYSSPWESEISHLCICRWLALCVVIMHTQWMFTVFEFYCYSRLRVILKSVASPWCCNAATSGYMLCFHRVRATLWFDCIQTSQKTS